MMTFCGVLHDEGGVVGRAELDRLLLAAAAAGRRGLAAEAAEDHRDEGAVHRVAHDVGQDRAGGADQRAGDDQRRIAEREADAGGGPAGIGVQHRDHDRHVGAADRDDHEHAERQRDDRDQPEVERAAGHHEADDEEHQRERERDVDDVAAGRMIGAPLMRADSFRNAITEPVKVSAPMATPSDISTRLCGWMWPGVPMSKASGA